MTLSGTDGGASTSTVLVVCTDASRREDLASTLRRRYEADHAVAVMTAAQATPESIAGLGAVSVALAPIGTDDFDALALVAQHHPAARRIAVVSVGDTGVREQLGRALTLGRVDYFVGHPWATPDEELHPVIGEALRTWSRAQLVQLDKVTVVDVVHGGRGQQLVTWLNRNTVAARFCLADSPEGSRLLEGPMAGADLPAALLWDGRVLADLEESVLAEALGAGTRPQLDSYDVAIVGAGPAGLASAVYAASEGLRTVVIEGSALGGQAGTSAKIRNYLGFLWGVTGADLASRAASQAEQLGAELVGEVGAGGHLLADKAAFLKIDTPHLRQPKFKRENFAIRHILMALRHAEAQSEGLPIA